MQVLQEGAQATGYQGLALKDGRRMPVAKNNLKRRRKAFSLPCDSSTQPQRQAGTLTEAGGQC